MRQRVAHARPQQLAGSGVLLPAGQKKPLGQSAQPVDPGSPWYVPSGHVEQSGVRSAAAKLPALHSTDCVEPATQKEPAGQSVHSASSPRSVSAEKLPAGHGSAAAAPTGQ